VIYVAEKEGNSEDNENKSLEGFELGNELSALVAKNIIPPRLAEKLEHKLKEKQIKISKKQLNILVDKIRNIMRTYSKFDYIDKKDSTERLEPQRIEERKISPPTIVTTEDIQVPEKITIPVQELKLYPLTEIPNNPESIIVLMKWLQYLIDKCGRSYLPEILDYYVDIGWISEDAKINLIDYSNGITDDKKRENIRPGLSDLPARDHIQSLLFIQKLKGRQFDKHFLDRIDGEISKITKKLNNYS